MSALMKSNNFLIIKVTFRKRRSTRSQASAASFGVLLASDVIVTLRI